VLDAICEAYGTTPAERVGLTSADDFMVALAFDAGVRLRAQEWQAEQMKSGAEENRAHSPAPRNTKAAWDEWVKSLPEDSPVRESLRRGKSG